MAIQEQISDLYRFGGHQTFPLRTATAFPKAAKGLSEGRDVLGNVVEGVVSMGLGKNMMKRMRCWADAYGVAFRDASGWHLTQDGKAIFGPTGTIAISRMFRRCGGCIGR